MKNIAYILFLTCLLLCSCGKVVKTKIANNPDVIFILANDFGFSAHHKYNSDFDAGNEKQQRHTTDITKRNLATVNNGQNGCWRRYQLRTYAIWGVSN